jgi:hypothetical protein
MPVLKIEQCEKVDKQITTELKAASNQLKNQMCQTILPNVAKWGL